MVQDVEFLRGCWFQKAEPDMPAMISLRLMPDEHGGYGGTTEGEHVPPIFVWFARDGAEMSITRPIDRPQPTVAYRAAALPPEIKATLPNTPHRATFAYDPRFGDWKVAEGDDSTLDIYDPGQPSGFQFHGERVPCD
jgi:hypothetical protein